MSRQNAASPETYEEFVRMLEARPAGYSPLRFVASMVNRPPCFDHWMMRWLRESRDA